MRFHAAIDTKTHGGNLVKKLAIDIGSIFVRIAQINGRRSLTIGRETIYKPTGDFVVKWVWKWPKTKG